MVSQGSEVEDGVALSLDRSMYGRVKRNISSPSGGRILLVASAARNPCERGRNKMTDIRKETDSLGEVDVPADKLWGPQTQRSLEHFSIGKDLIPRELITSYAILKKAAANANHVGQRLDDQRHKLIVHACDEILAGEHHDMFPLHV